MSSHWPTIKDIFHQASELDPALRAKFLARACQDDDLRREVESLLAHRDSGTNVMFAPLVQTTAGSSADAGHQACRHCRRVGSGVAWAPSPRRAGGRGRQADGGADGHAFADRVAENAPHWSRRRRGRPAGGLGRGRVAGVATRSGDAGTGRKVERG